MVKISIMGSQNNVLVAEVDVLIPYVFSSLESVLMGSLLFSVQYCRSVKELNQHQHQTLNLEVRDNDKLAVF